MELKEKLANLPKKPGCYQMKNNDGVIIYVGKAKNLYNRVNSYFRGIHDAKTTKLVSQIYDFEYIITSTETEAFILEINLIKKHNPKYNILLTDDKTYPYICITNERHPKIYYTRDISKSKAKYYGPYPNSWNAKEACDLLNKIFPLRKCNKIPKKECLYYHLNQCLAPCINDVKIEEYKEIINKINSVLKGNVTNEIKTLELKMQEASDKLDFEKAIEYRNLINSLNVVSERQKMEIDINDSDIFNYATTNDLISIQVFHIRDGKMIERNGFLFDLNNDEFDIFENFIMQFYLIKNNPIPKEIILPLHEYNLFNEEIKKRLVIPKQGKKLDLLKLVHENAYEKIEILSKSNEQVYKKTIGALIDLGKLLNIKTPHIIEAFDNSNIQGTSSVSAMVCFIDGLPSKKNYRKFKVKTVKGSNDVETMKEVVLRRYNRLKIENKQFPDLIVIDGGKGQVKYAKKALKDIGIEINILCLVKNEMHKTEFLLFNEKEYKIDKKSGLFLLLESIQDEVHRYAITFHHLVHTKNSFSSSLDQIKGIGPVKKQAILKLLSSKDLTEENLKALKLNEEQIQKIITNYK